MANAFCDFGLVKAGFRSLSDIFKLSNEKSADDILNALNENKAIFEEAMLRWDWVRGGGGGSMVEVFRIDYSKL